MQSQHGRENIKDSSSLQGQMEHHMPEAVDQVHRYPSNGIKALIVGPGVGRCIGVLAEGARSYDEHGGRIIAVGSVKFHPSMHVDYHQNVYDCSIHGLSSTAYGGRGQKSCNWSALGLLYSSPLTRGVPVSFSSLKLAKL